MNEPTVNETVQTQARDTLWRSGFITGFLIATIIWAIVAGV